VTLFFIFGGSGRLFAERRRKGQLTVHLACYHLLRQVSLPLRYAETAYLERLRFDCERFLRYERRALRRLARARALLIFFTGVFDLCFGIGLSFESYIQKKNLRT
jgi:hypothetical protein